MTRKGLFIHIALLAVCWCTLPLIAPAQDILLRYGDSRVDALTMGAQQAYRFQGGEGDRITIRIADGTAAFDSRLEVFAPDGRLLIAEWDRGGFEFRLNLNLAENGAYRIQVSDQDADEAGSYGISLHQLNSGPAPVALSKGEDLRASIDDKGMMRAYLFCGAGGDRVELRLRGLDPAFDSQLELYGPRGTLIASDFGAENTAAVIEATLQEEGLYTVLVADSGGNDTGGYSLGFESDGACVVTGIRPWLCEDQSYIWNGTLYDKNRNSDFRISGDTIYVVWLDFSTPVGFLRDTLCRDEAVIVNGTRYDTGRPSGRELLANRSSSGCDSILEVRLTFIDTVVSQFRSTLCPSAAITVNGTVYDRNNPSGTERIAGGSVGGCDSLVEVQLDFYPPAAGVLERTICRGASLTVNGTVYDESRPRGTELLAGAAANGCDSLVEVRLKFYPPATGTLERTICRGASLTINGTVYDENRTRGTERLVGAAANGCDSLVEVLLNFFPPATGTLERTLCPGGAFTFKGTVYDETRPTGTEVLPGVSVNGCDSIVQVRVVFDGPVTGRVEETLCPGGSLTINGTVYDARNPTGVEVIPGGALGGCDSLVAVRVSFLTPSAGMREETLCPGASLTINGTVYDAANPSGMEILPGAAVSGCDSIVQVRVSYYTPATGVLEETLCPEASVMVNGTVYDRNRPAGVERLEGAAANGCDSIVQIRLRFLPGAVTTVEELLCPDEFIRINGTIYDRLNPSGTEIIPGAAPNGCDSVIQVRLSFYPEATRMVEELLCYDEFIRVNGTIYDRMNPSGTEAIPGVAANGCDSIVQIRLRFYPEATGRLETLLCPEELLTLNGTIYDRFNPSGTEVLAGAAANGCDSVVQVRLRFHPGGAEVVQASLCPGEALEVNGTIYDRFNPSGLEILPGAAASGCDSLIEVALDFFPEAAGVFEQELCQGESVVINGTVYDETNPAGAEVLPGAAVNGCDSVLQVLLTFGGDCSPPEDFYIPSGITPNGDGLNDRFVIPAIDQNPEFFDNSELIVTSRWGKVVYEAAPYHNDWTGTDPNGTRLPAGTYFYSFRYGAGREAQRTGELTIIR